MNYKDVAEYVINMRKSVGWDQQRLADEMGEDISVVQRMESGRIRGVKIKPFVDQVRLKVANEHRRKRVKC